MKEDYYNLTEMMRMARRLNETTYRADLIASIEKALMENHRLNRERLSIGEIDIAPINGIDINPDDLIAL